MISFLVAVVLAVVLWTRAPLPAQRVRSSLLPPSGSSFLGYSFAISPDGTRLAFSALAPDGKTALWVRLLSSSGAQQLSGTEGATSPFWSPDSRQIGFFAENHLKTVDVAGGAVQTLCESRFYFGGAWNREGTIVFAPELDGPLYRVPATGGVPVPTTRILSQGTIQAHRWSFFLPDGRHFLYSIDWRSQEEAKNNGIYAGALDSDQSKLVLPEVTGNVLFASGYILFVRDRNLMAQPFDSGRLQDTGPPVSIAEQAFEPQVATSQIGLSVSENGLLVFQSAADSPTRLVWYDRTGEDLGEFPEAGYRDPSFSPDGRFLAVSSDDERNGKRFIRVYDLKRGISTRLTDGGHEYFPIWSRDGRRIVYGAPAGTFPMYEVAADGSPRPRETWIFAPGPGNGWTRIPAPPALT